MGRALRWAPRARLAFMKRFEPYLSNEERAAVRATD